MKNRSDKGNNRRQKEIMSLKCRQKRSKQNKKIKKGRDKGNIHRANY